MSDVYSYHTFILPFTWRCKGDEIDKFIKYLDENVSWVNTDMKTPNDISTTPTIENIEEKILLHKEYQYFHPYVRKAIYGFDEGIVHNYSFMHDVLHNKAQYIIKKGNEEIVLSLNAIRLKVFNTGVALFIMECENRDIDRQKNIDTVKKINEYGRRINLPFIAQGYFLCADKLIVDIPNVKRFETDFKGFVEKAYNDPNCISMTHMCDFIKDILEYGGMYKFTSHYAIENNKFYVYPLIDDRMYVQCLVDDSEYTNAVLCECNGEEQLFAYEVDEHIAKDLYELIYIDSPGDCSCQNYKMRTELIEKALYTRWTSCKSLYAITDYSFVFISSNPPQHLIESFVTQYFQMICLALAQRTSLLKFKREVAAFAKGLEKRGRSISKGAITKIMDLQERFVAFDAQLFFVEVSPEQQGIEIYDILKSAVLLEKEKDSLKEQLVAVNEAANSSISFSINKVMLIFTWVAAFISFFSMCISTLQIGGISERFTSSKDVAVLYSFNCCVVLSFVGICIVLCLLSIVLVMRNYRRRK